MMIEISRRLTKHLTAVRNAEGAVRFPYVGWRKAPGFAILIYHRVTEAPDSYLPSLSLADFRLHMAVLSRHFEVLPLAEVLARQARGDDLDRAVAITFDDGYRDNLTCAFPVLQHFGLPATIFLATGAIGTDEILWHDQVFDLFSRTSQSEVEWDGELLPLGARGRAASMQRVLEDLKRLSPQRRKQVLLELSSQLRAPLKCSDPKLMLNWNEVRTLRREGITFGVHTVTHTVLTALDSVEARAEILHSKRRVEEELEEPATLFAYPNGTRQDFSDESIEVLREAGFAAAVTTIFGTNGPGINRFALRRCSCYGGSPSAFACRLIWYNFLAQSV